MKHKKIFLTTFLSCALAFGSGCTVLGISSEEIDDDLSTANLLTTLVLATSTTTSCTSFPATITDNGFSVTWTCSVNGLVLTCASGATSVAYTFPSVDAAQKSNVYSPSLISRQPATIRVSKAVLSTLPTTLTYTLDSSNRLTNISVDNPASNLTFSNYDSNGFPMSVGGDATATVTYTYSAGSTLPDSVVLSGGLTDTFNFSGGVMTSYNIGGGAKTVTTSGSVLMCQ